MTGVRISFHNFLSPYVLTRWIIVDDTVQCIHTDDDGNVRFIVKVSNPYSPLPCVSEVPKLLRFSFRNEIVSRLTHFFSNRLSTQPSFMATTSKAFTVGKGGGICGLKNLTSGCCGPQWIRYFQGQRLEKNIRKHAEKNQKNA